MIKHILAASVAILALTVPAEAERGERRGQAAERSQQGQKAKAHRGNNQRVERRQNRVQARTQPRSSRQERSIQTRSRSVEARANPQRQRVQRQRLVDIRGRGQSQVERRARKLESRRDSRRQVERSIRAPDRKVFRNAQRVRSDERRRLRRAQQQDRQFVQRDFKQFQRQERSAARSEARAARKHQAVQRDRTWEQLANRVTRFDKDRRYRHQKTGVARIGERVRPALYPDYAPVRYSSYYQPTRDFYYRYDDDNGRAHQTHAAPSRSACPLRWSYSRPSART